jgi:hypothetical protein
MAKRGGSSIGVRFGGSGRQRAAEERSTRDLEAARQATAERAAARNQITEDLVGFKGEAAYQVSEREHERLMRDLAGLIELTDRVQRMEKEAAGPQDFMGGSSGQSAEMDALTGSDGGQKRSDGGSEKLDYLRMQLEQKRQSAFDRLQRYQLEITPNNALEALQQIQGMPVPRMGFDEAEPLMNATEQRALDRLQQNLNRYRQTSVIDGMQTRDPFLDLQTPAEQDRAAALRRVQARASAARDAIGSMPIENERANSRDNLQGLMGQASIATDPEAPAAQQAMSFGGLSNRAPVPLPIEAGEQLYGPPAPDGNPFLPQ